MANSFRNEVDVKLGDKSFKLRATFNAIAEIEDQLDVTFYDLVMKLQHGQVRARHARVIIVEGIKGAGGTPNLEEIDEAFETVGIAAVIPEILKFILQAFMGAPATEKKE